MITSVFRYFKVFLVGYVLVNCYLQSSWAAFSNYNSILIGDLAAGMGGAATAVPGDVSSASFYNPSTLAHLPGSAFSANVGIYKKFDTVYGGNQDLVQAPLRVNQGFFRSLPASTGNVLEINGYKLGLSIVVPDYDTFKGELNKTTDNVSTLNYVDESLWVGLSAAKELDADRSWGVSVYYTARNFSQTINDRSSPSAQRSIIYNKEKNITENALISVLGYYQRLNPDWSWGVSFRTPGVRVAGQATINETTTTMDTTGPTLTKDEGLIPTLGAPARIPAKLSLGLSYRPNDQWLWAFDTHFYEGLSYDDVDTAQYATRVNNRALANFSFGAQWSWYEWLKIRSGLFTNFSSHPDPDPSLAKSQEDRVDMLGFSANVVFIAKNKVGYTFGGYYTGGNGRSIQRMDQNFRIVTKSQHVFTMLVGSHFNF